MVLSNRLTGIPQRGGLAKRTLIYMAAFGLGSLLVVSLLSFVLVSLADGLLPDPSGPASPVDTALPAGTAAPGLDKPKGSSPLRRKPAGARPATKGRTDRKSASDKPTRQLQRPSAPTTAGREERPL